MSDRRLAELRDLEAISELKARYFRLVDTKDWDRFRQLFVSDARFELLDARETIDGADAFVAFARSALNASKSAHHGHTPEITLDSPIDAHGTWALADYVEWPSADATGERRGFKGYGLYEETYRKVDGEWKIAGWRLGYARMDPLYPEPLPGSILGFDAPALSE
jgi:hypothetical protein